MGENQFQIAPPVTNFLRAIFAIFLCPLLSAAPSIRDFALKAEKKEPLSVVFFGGSLTFGANASDPTTTSYRGLMADWLREKYPNTPITFHDAAIGGTGSQLGMFRLERDVLQHKPDLVFLDFTVNDNAEGTDGQPLASYECIVRTLLENDCAVMPVLMLFKWHAEKKADDPFPPRHQAHLELSSAYNLPHANVLEYVRAKVNAGTDPAALWNVGDGVHPGDPGYRFFFKAVRDSFELATTDTTAPILPSETHFENLYPYRERDILVSDLPDGWKQSKTWRTALWFDGMASRWMGDIATTSEKAKSGPLEIEFEGSMVGIFGERNGLTPPVKIWIDGEPVQHPKAKEGDFLWNLDTSRFSPPKKGSGNLFLWQAIAKDLPDGKHILRIEPIWEGANRDAELRIESICSAGR